MKRVRDPDDLRRAVDERGLSQRELARIARCGRGTIGFLLQGRSTSDDTAARLARALRRPVDSLFADVVSSSATTFVKQQAVA